MAEYPTKKTQTLNAVKNSFIVGSSVPVVHSINGNLLEKEGWKRVGNEYHKSGYILKYNGVSFIIGGEKYQHMEDLPV